MTSILIHSKLLKHNFFFVQFVEAVSAATELINYRATKLKPKPMRTLST